MKPKHLRDCTNYYIEKLHPLYAKLDTCVQADAFLTACVVTLGAVFSNFGPEFREDDLETFIIELRKSVKRMGADIDRRDAQSKHRSKKKRSRK